MGYRVVVDNQPDYNYKTLRGKIFSIIETIAGGKLSSGKTALIKPNLLSPATEEKAMLTHPLVVRAVAEYLIEHSLRVVISDSPAMGSFRKVLKEGGFLEALDGLPVEFREFKETTMIDIGKPFGEVELARDVVEADYVFNLPKLKTHSQMLLTLGVKNLFGCVVGFSKPKWHYKVGVDRKRFAQLLYQISRAVNPVVTIIDGVLAMEGDGPGKSGKPRKLGLLIGGNSPVATDVIVCRIFGLEPSRLLTNTAAMEDGFRPETIEVKGNIPLIDNYRFPNMGPIMFGPERLHGLLRKHLIERPVVSDEQCRQCGECWNYCPASALQKGDKSVRFEYEKCIRCYCCVEVCPHGALRVKEPLAGRALRRIVSLKER